MKLLNKIINDRIEEYINNQFKNYVKREFGLYGHIEFQEYKCYNLHYIEIYIDGKKVLLYSRKNVFDNLLYFDGYKKIIYLNMQKKKIIKDLPDFIKG